jgi:PAS domain-containing protein
MGDMMDQLRDTIEGAFGNEEAVQLLTSVLNSLNTPVAITDISGQVIFTNKAGQAEPLHANGAAGSNNNIFDTETEIPLGDGKKVIVKSRNSQMANGAANPGQGVSAQFEAGGLISSILDELPVSVFVKDSELRHVFVNKQNEIIFQRPRSDVIGKSDMELYDANIAAPLMLIDKNVVETGATRCDHDLFEREDEDDLVLRTTKNARCR